MQDFYQTFSGGTTPDPRGGRGGATPPAPLPVSAQALTPNIFDASPPQFGFVLSTAMFASK